MPSFRSVHHPWVSYFLADRLHTIPRVKPRVFKAFVNFSNLPEIEAATCLKNGMLPHVRLAHRPGTYGYTPIGENHIELEKTFVNELEAALQPHPRPRANRHAPTDLEVKALTLLEVSVLHEMVHFFRYKTMDGVKIAAASKRGRDREEAIADGFEEAAYGFQPGVRRLALERYLPRTAAYMGGR